MAISPPNFTAPVLEKNTLFTLAWKSFFRDLFARVAGTKDVMLGGVLHTDVTAVGNVGSGEDTLITYTLPSAVMSTDEDVIEIEAFGTLAANGNSKNIKLYFGSQVIFTTGAVASNAKDWHIKATVVRSGAATQVITSAFSGDTVLVTQTADYVAGTQSLAASVVIKCTGEATTTNDIVQQGLIVKLFPAV